MPEGQVLEFSRVTKRFGAVTAVAGLSARVTPGQVTGFLGPNGAGKTTSLRILLGLVRPSEGTATIGGVPYAKLSHPLRTVGAALEASSFHPGRSGANHLRVYARAASLPLSRVDEVLGMVGLADAAGRKVGAYSLGMRQRLGLATALLGDPGVLVLDEPVNGLDPEGIRWMRTLLQGLAAEGRTVLISSHILSEVQQTVDALVIVSQGKLVFQGESQELGAQDEPATIVDAPDRTALTQALTAEGYSFDLLRSGLTVRGAEPAEIGALATRTGISLSALQRRGLSLEDVFLELVNGVRVHPSATAVLPETVPAAAAPETPSDEAAEATDAPETTDVPDATDPAAPVTEEAVSPEAAPGEAAPAEAASVPETRTEDSPPPPPPLPSADEAIAPPTPAPSSEADHSPALSAESVEDGDDDDLDEVPVRTLEETELFAPRSAREDSFAALIADVTSPAAPPAEESEAEGTEAASDTAADASADALPQEPIAPAESAFSFQVARTGVIDVIPRDEASDSPHEDTPTEPDPRVDAPDEEGTER